MIMMSNMTSNNTVRKPPLKCFQHCRKDIDLVCFNIPYTCPLCKKCTAVTESRVPPYILPSPFTSSEKCPRSVLLKPTQGDFIGNYIQMCNLHIGVSDKNGFVYDFDEKGLKYGPPWPDCLTASFDIPFQGSAWDSSLLKAVGNSELWGAERYHEERWNCFDFVLYFIKHLAAYSESHSGFATMSKEDFTNLFLTRKTKKAEQYIHLYRQVITTSCVAVTKQDTS